MANLLRVVGCFILMLFACSLFTTQLAAQTDLGAVQGHVQDQQSKAITGVTVTLRNPSTAFDRTVQTDSSGNYSFIGVPLTGHYVLTVKAAQFKPLEQNDILLRAQGVAVFDFTLTVSGTN